MTKPRLYIMGLGAERADDITLGTLRRLLQLTTDQSPILLRTSQHPTVAFLQEEGVSFTRSFDPVYEAAATFDDVYTTIVDEIITTLNRHGTAGYAVPGHPLVGERTVSLLLAKADSIDIEILPGSSFIEACLNSVKKEVTGIVVLDALSLPDTSDPFIKPSLPFIPSLPHLIYQVYDNTVASNVKLALLERYSPEFVVTIISAGASRESGSAKMTPLRELDFADNRFDHLTSVYVPETEFTIFDTEFNSLLNIMARLRHPEKGCPWDREQTPETLKRFAVEEVYEVLDAIDDGDVEKYVEELGDLLLQVVFHAQLAREAGDFTIEDVVLSISEKLVRRHPHVFADTCVSSSDDVLVNWELIKKAEKGNEARKSRLDGVPRHLPALQQAQEISKRAAKAGFEWGNIDGVFEKVDEELGELREAIKAGDQTHTSSELGDLLFTVVNLARFCKVDAEDALRMMVARFNNRFRLMESSAGKPLEHLSFGEFDELWRAAKREEIQKTHKV